MVAGIAEDESAALAWLALVAIALSAGAVFASLVPRPRDSAGAAVVRGAVYGFVLWVILNRTLLPLIAGDGLPWSVNDAREDFAALFAYILLGAGIGLIEQWLDSVWRTLFSDAYGGDDDEGAGAQGLRAIGRGALAGIVGGLLFTYVMVEIGALDNVGNILRVESEFAGIVVHFAIAVIWGATYGLLFRRQTYDRGSAIGWGLSYGVVVWVVGPNTLLPILLGGTPDWTAENAAALTASLVGHLAYGAALGLTFHHFEARFSPWWIPQRMADAARAQRRREQALTSAPAIWGAGRGRRGDAAGDAEHGGNRVRFHLRRAVARPVPISSRSERSSRNSPAFTARGWGTSVLQQQARRTRLSADGAEAATELRPRDELIERC